MLLMHFFIINDNITFLNINLLVNTYNLNKCVYIIIYICKIINVKINFSFINNTVMTIWVHLILRVSAYV